MFSHVITILSFAALKAKSFETKAKFSFLWALNCCTFQDFKLASTNWNVVELIYHQCVALLSDRGGMFQRVLVAGFFPLAVWPLLLASPVYVQLIHQIAKINLILFLRLFSEFPDDFSVTLWEWREKREGTYIYVLHIPTGAHLSASGKLYQLKNLKVNFALVSPEAVMPAVPKRRDLVPPLQSRAAQLVLQELESSWWGPWQGKQRWGCF